jgi:formate--tetrahydrofolate ligase
MADLADRVVAAAASGGQEKVQPIYTANQSLEEKITTIATKVYGAARVAFKPAARSRLQRLGALGYERLPVCIAKTQYSFTDDPTVMGAPQGWTLTISDVTLSAGAGFVVAIAGSMMLMPGLGKVPQAQKLDVDESGQVLGMDY